jgi:hypothetical protein
LKIHTDKSDFIKIYNAQLNRWQLMETFFFLIVLWILVSAIMLNLNYFEGKYGFLECGENSQEWEKIGTYGTVFMLGHILLVLLPAL